jgi:hypothetical protein
MNAGIRFLFALVLLGATPVFAAKPAATPSPSVQLRQLIDKTLPGISSLSDPNHKPFDRTALTTAQAIYSAEAQTATPEKQPMYQAVLNVMAILLGAVEEHNKAVADFENSKKVHGVPDTKDLEISNPRHGWDPAAVARANKAKEDHVNGGANNAALDKDDFFSKGAIAAWTKRIGQIQDLVTQSYTQEVVAEKQLAMLAPAATPPPPPATKPKSKPKQTKDISALDEHSPVGSWKAANPSNRSATLKEDNTVTGWKRTGTWNWTDQSKGALAIIWSDGLTSNVILSPDGRTMEGKATNGHDVSFTRATSPPATEAVAAQTASAPPPAVAEIRLDADSAKSLSAHPGKAVGISPEHATKFRLQPGLKDQSLVSLEPFGHKGFYLRHQRGVLFLHERPNEDLLFEADATFKLVHLDGNKVRFESCNFPGTFITARDDGSVVVIRDPLPAQSIFVLKAD